MGSKRQVTGSVERFHGKEFIIRKLDKRQDQAVYLPGAKIEDVEVYIPCCP